MESEIEKKQLTPKPRTKLDVKLFFTYTITIFLLFLFFYPILTRSGVGASYYIFTFTIFFLWAAFSLTLNLEVGFLGIPNFGKVAFIAIGGYSYAIFTESLQKRYAHGDPMFFGLLQFRTAYLIVFGLIFATIVTGLFGALLTLPTIRLREDFLAIVTIVAGEIVRYVANNEEFFNTFSGFSVANPVFQKYNPDQIMSGLFLGTTQFLIYTIIIVEIFVYHRNMVKNVDLPYLKNLRFQRLVTFNVILAIIILFYEFFTGVSPSIGLHFLLIQNIVFLIIYKNYLQDRFDFMFVVLISETLGLISFIFQQREQEIIIKAREFDDIVNIEQSMWIIIVTLLMLIGYGIIFYLQSTRIDLKDFVDSNFKNQSLGRVNLGTSPYSSFLMVCSVGVLGSIGSFALFINESKLVRGFYLGFGSFLLMMLTFFFIWKVVSSVDVKGEKEGDKLFLLVTGFVLTSISIINLNVSKGPSFGYTLIMVLYLIVTYLYLRFWIEKAEFSILTSIFMALASFSLIVGSLGGSFNLRKITIRDQTIIKTVDWYSCMYTFFAMLVIYVIIEELYNSPFGRNLKAIREDEISATSVGKDVFDYRLKALVIASALTGFAGAVYAQIITIVSPKQYEPVITFTIYIMLIIGGTGNNKGAIFGAFIIQLLFAVTRGTLFADSELYYPDWGASLSGILDGSFELVDSSRSVDAENLGLIIVGVMLILFLIYSPEGLIPERKKDNQRYYDLVNYYEGKEEDDNLLSSILSRFVSEEEKTEHWDL